MFFFKKNAMYKNVIYAIDFSTTYLITLYNTQNKIPMFIIQ